MTGTSLPQPQPRPDDLTAPGGGAAAWRRAFSLAREGNWPALAALPRDPQHRELAPGLEKVLTWLRLTDSRSDAGFAEISAFLLENPAWPRRARLIERAEQSLPETLPTALKRHWFTRIPPRSAGGRLKYLHSLEDGPDREGLARTVRAYWHETPLGARTHYAFLKRYGTMLDPEDHWIRLDRMLWQGHLASARRSLPLVSMGRQYLARARMKLRTRSPGVDGAIRRIPIPLLTDPGLHYERLRWRHREGQNDSALELLWSVAPGQSFPRLWWQERARQIRYALDENRYEDAYMLSASHIQRDGISFAEAEWQAGWIALRFADKPREALNAFSRLYKKVSTPISLARAAYWAGRASEALAETGAAHAWYRQAAMNPATFYGQLAQARLGANAYRLPPEPRPDAAGRKAFHESEMVRIAAALERIGEAGLARLFVRHLGRHAVNGPQAAMAAGLARQLGYPDISVATARRAARKGITLSESGYPTRYAGAHGALEPALMLSIIRQESGFDTKAQSPAGARGLMQLMPATAREVSRRTGKRYSKRRLTEDPAFNIALGSAYLSRLIDSYDGSYVLAVAAYNAGPGNVNRWLRERGDPRRGAGAGGSVGGVGLIDWIERIPFAETRNYVHRVLEGLVVYRAILRAEGHSFVTLRDRASPADIWCVAICGASADSFQAQVPARP